MIIYSPIMQMLSAAGWSSYRLRVEKRMSQGTMNRIRHGGTIDTTTINTICELCHCQPGDLMQWEPDEEKQNKSIGGVGREGFL